jgi:antitoxin component YwqK of YwqJK toxin-antitoxin module
MGGQKQTEIKWVYGEQHGKAEGWYNNGQPMSVTQWENGKLDGESVNWYENGQKKEEVSLVKGRPSGLAKTWYQNGQKSGEINFDNGLFVSGRKWKPDGNPCPITNLKDGDGESVVYDDSGKVVKTLKFRDGIKLDEKVMGK